MYDEFGRFGVTSGLDHPKPCSRTLLVDAVLPDAEPDAGEFVHARIKCHPRHLLAEDIESADYH